MTSTWRLIIGFGSFGALLTFLFSMGNNPYGTTFLRSFYAFVVFTALAAALRYVFSQLLVPEAKKQDKQNASEEDRGTVLDISTPDEGDSLNEMMKEQWAGGKADPIKGFQPLQPKKLVTIDDPDPEEVVRAIRTMKDE